jgi:hypothetical protein
MTADCDSVIVLTVLKFRTAQLSPNSDDLRGHWIAKIRGEPRNVD